MAIDIRKGLSSLNRANFSKFRGLIKKVGFRRALSTILAYVTNKTNNASKAITAKALATNELQVMQPYVVKIKKPIDAERKKVLHIIENFYTGGSSRLIIDLVENLGHIYDQKVFTFAHRERAEFLGIDITTIDVDIPSFVLKQINDFKPDIIHVHIWRGEWYNKVFDILEHVKECAVIQNINTPLEPIVRDFISKYIFVSNYVLNSFYKQDDKAIVIHPGSNFDIFTREMSENYLPCDTIGMVYRLDDDKLSTESMDVFIRAVEKRPETKAIIVGGGMYYEEYKRKVEKAGLTESITFTGYVHYEALPDLYKKFTLFVAPVWQESFGQVAPFAMNMGIPVVGYNIGALEEIINDKSLLAKSADVEQLSDIIVHLLDNYEKCVSVGRYNYERASKSFAVEKMIADYEEVYNYYSGR